MGRPTNDAEKVDRQGRILQAVIDILATQGISGVSMRAVAREAGVALGLVSYHYEDKTPDGARDARRARRGFRT